MQYLYSAPSLYDLDYGTSSPIYDLVLLNMCFYFFVFGSTAL